MVEFYLLTFSRFPLRKKEHKSYFGKNRTHDFRTSRCAGYLLDHSGDESFPLTRTMMIVSPTDDVNLCCYLSFIMIDYTSYFVTVGLSNTVQLRLLGNCSMMLELLESLLCCLARHFFVLLSFPDVIMTCSSTSVSQALRHQAYTKHASVFWKL